MFDNPSVSIRLPTVCAVALLSFALPAVLPAQTTLPSADHTSNGLQLSDQTLTLRVDALRPDVLRVRIFPKSHPAQIPEDASWAVLPESRTARIAVTPEPSGFSTSALRVSVTLDLRLTVSDLSNNILQTDAMSASFAADNSFTVTKSKSPEDHFFGLGDKPGPLDRTGQSFAMWNSDTFGWQESTDPIYKSIPFFLEMHSGRTIGVLFDNTFRTYFDFGHQRPDRYTFSAPSGPLDYYMLYGPEPKRVLETYAWLTGPAPLPPLWILGYQQSRYTYTPRSQVEEIAAHLRSDHIPANAIYLDIDYQYKLRPFTVDPTTFPDFPGLIHKLADEHFHTILITDLPHRPRPRSKLRPLRHRRSHRPIRQAQRDRPHRPRLARPLRLPRLHPGPHAPMVGHPLQRLHRRRRRRLLERHERARRLHLPHQNHARRRSPPHRRARL
jgi:alpha-glucosidase